jgi:hypothetical protein
VNLCSILSFVYIYIAIVDPVITRAVISLSDLTPPHYRACPKPGPGFPTSTYGVRFQSFADSASLVGERLKSFPRVSEISLSCTFAGVRFYMSPISTKWTIISHLHSLNILSAVFSFVFVYVLLADDHVNNVSYFPFMSIKKVVPYFCVLREGYYIIILCQLSPNSPCFSFLK